MKLSRAHCELAEAYLPEGERKAAYARGEALALQALRLDPVFLRVERERGFRAALGVAGDVGAIFWYGNNLGRLLAYDYGRALFGGTRDVLAAFTRAVELDEGYWGGGPHRALANFLAQTPGFLGGDVARAVERDPAFLQTHVDWAEFGAARDGGLCCELLGRGQGGRSRRGRPLAPHGDIPEPTLRTLAVIVHRAPVLQSEVVKIRGQRAYGHIGDLLARGFIVAQAQGPTKVLIVGPALLAYFGVSSVEELRARLDLL